MKKDDEEESRFTKRRFMLTNTYGFSFEQAEFLAALFMRLDSSDTELQKKLKKLKKQLKACREGKT